MQTTAKKLIWHFDLDSFFVSAERLRAPELRGRPVAVGGEGPRAVISSCSYEARKFGVRSAMPTAKALRLCPSLFLCPVDFTLYSRLSKEVFSIVESFTPVFEATGIDEGYLDMTGSEGLYGPPLIAGAKLREAVFKKTGLTISIGMAANRLVAKIATDLCKPDNMMLVPFGKEAETLAPLPVGKIQGCGKVTEKWLLDRGLDTIAKLQTYPIDVLESHLGKFGTYLHEAAWGIGSTEFHEEAKTRSISRETTFDDDCSDVQEFKKILWAMATELGQSLREAKIFARAIRLKLRYPPFQTVSRSRVLKSPTQSDRELFLAVETLFDDNWETSSPLRLLGMGCVLGDGVKQLGLFDHSEKRERLSEIDHLKDEIQKRFGDKALRTGRDIK